jgi:hypothetical protein
LASTSLRSEQETQSHDDIVTNDEFDFASGNENKAIQLRQRNRPWTDVMIMETLSLKLLGGKK